MYESDQFLTGAYLKLLIDASAMGPYCSVCQKKFGLDECPVSALGQKREYLGFAWG
jgi:hypothetical protein